MGAQYIRAGSIVQLLLGNIGRPGGGILALRGHASIQGCTDIPTLYNLLPGYLPMPSPATPTSRATSASITEHASRRASGTTPTPTWCRCSRSTGARTPRPDNDFCFDYLPRIDGDHGVYRTLMDMVDGKIPGYFLFGQNPAVGMSNGRLARLGMAQLDWLVVRDLVMIESATFWKDARRSRPARSAPSGLPHRGVLLPGRLARGEGGHLHPDRAHAAVAEKAVEPSGDQTSELWFAYHLGRILRERLAASTDVRDRPLLDLSWDYAKHGHEDEWGEPDAEDVLRRINGYHLDTGKPVGDYRELRADGSTSAGCWIYSGVFRGGVNLSARRRRRPGRQVGLGLAAGPAGPLQPGVGRPGGQARGASARRWSGGTRRSALGWATTSRTSPTTCRPGTYRGGGAVGPAALRGDDAFVLQADGKAWLFAPNGVLDGPLPTHYEPDESPVRNRLHGRSRATRRAGCTGARTTREPSGGHRGVPVRAHRVPAHRAPHRGGMSRWLPFLAELQPELFVEVSPELAAERGLEHNGWCHVITSRTAVQAGSWSPSGSGRCGCRGRPCTRSGCPTTSGPAGWPPAT